MAFNFPNNPTVGQKVYNPDSKLTYTWDGTVWDYGREKAQYALTSATLTNPTLNTGEFVARRSQYGVGNNTINTITWDLVDKNTLTGLTYNGGDGTFTNTSGKTKKYFFSFGMSAYTLDTTWGAGERAGTGELAIWFTQNSNNGSSDRVGFISDPGGQYLLTGAPITIYARTFAKCLNTSYTFVMAPGDVIRTYFFVSITSIIAFGNGSQTNYPTSGLITYNSTNNFNQAAKIHVTEIL